MGDERAGWEQSPSLLINTAAAVGNMMLTLQKVGGGTIHLKLKMCKWSLCNEIYKKKYQTMIPTSIFGLFVPTLFEQLFDYR